jgi:hypothetical protein
MKHYLVIGVLTFSVIAWSADNPFDLETNLKGLDTDQSILLDKLKRSEDKESASDKRVEQPAPANKKVSATVPVSEVEAVSSMPKELKFLDSLVGLKVAGKHKTVTGKSRENFEKLLKEKNNPDLTVEEIKKIFAGDQESGMSVMVYIIAKTMVLTENMTTEEQMKYADETSGSLGKKGNTEEIYKKYPEQTRALGFRLVEDILSNGIPSVDFAMEGYVGISASSSSDGEAKIEISTDTKAKKESRVSILDDIDLEKEAKLAKEKADKLYLKAIKEVEVNKYKEKHSALHQPKMSIPVESLPESEEYEQMRKKEAEKANKLYREAIKAVEAE